MNTYNKDNLHFTEMQLTNTIGIGIISDLFEIKVKTLSLIFYSRELLKYLLQFFLHFICQMV